MATIMIADDNKDIVETIKMILEKQGIETKEAYSGNELITKLEAIEKRPDLILLDVMMPGLTTSQILEKLKEKNINIKIILVTVVRFSDEELNQLMTEHNIVDYITKPFDIFEFISKIKKHLNNQAAA